MEKNPDRHDWMVFAFMLILVPLAGEPKFHPFSGDFSAFRVSFGSPVFLLFLLWLQHFPRMMLGCSAGIAVMLFRAGLDAAGGLPLPDALFIHIPNFFYYFAYALFFARPSLSRQTIYAQALAIAGWAVFAEVLASIAELAAMHALAFRDHYRLTVPMLLRLLGIAILRCFFILSFFFLFQLYNTEVQLRRKTKEKNRLSLLISGLYEEVFTLRCALQSAETVTRDCYAVYETLRSRAQSPEDEVMAMEVLRIAGECHEIKKNHQRILAGLQELTSNRHVDDYLPPDRIARLLIHVQQKYARSLGKDIVFHSNIPRGLPPLHVFLLLSMLNNLAANAVEAIDKRGTISLRMEELRSEDRLILHLDNTGSFIPPRRLLQIFRPGYTTKFDSSGKASSGVGLTYVLQQTRSLGGTIVIDSDGKDRVSCTITLPCHKLRQPAISDTERKNT